MLVTELLTENYIAVKCNTGIYAIKNTVNNKMYIGQTFGRGFHGRWVEHRRDLKNNKHHNKHLQRAWNKYGENKFVFEVLEYIDDINIIDQREIYWIAFYNSTTDKEGYNIEGGGSSNKIVSKETRDKLSKIRKGTKVSQQGCINIGLAKKGEKNPFYGKRLSKEHCKKISESNKGRVLSEDHKRKIGKSSKGRNIGENFTNVTINNEIAAKIKQDLVNNLGMVKLVADINDVSEDIVTQIKTLKTWSHIREDLNEKLIILKDKGIVRTPLFSKEDVIEIRKKYNEDKIRICDLAETYNTTRSMISRIVKGIGVYSLMLEKGD